MIDLSGKGWCIFGVRGSGKSWLVKKILDSTPDHLIYDPLDEHQGYRRYIPTLRASETELNGVINDLVIPRKPRLFIVDEANKYIRPKPAPLPSGVADLNDFARHWSISCGWVCRRMTQFSTDIVELSNHLFFFQLTGRNDWKYMEGLHQGLGEAVRNLGPYEYVSLTNGSEMELHAPVDAPVHAVHTGVTVKV
jgi:hypothetical protein